MYNPSTRKGIMYYIDEVIPLGVALDVTTLDLIFKGRFGERELSPLATSIVGDDPSDETLGQLALVFILYKDKWANLRSLYEEEVTLDTYTLTTEENEDTKTLSNQKSVEARDNTETNKVSGYDSELLLTDTQTETTLEGNTDFSKDDTGNRITTKKVVGSTGNRLDDRAKALALLETTYLETVMQDIVSEIGLHIY